ncbi:MAG: 50S ribosomal protein L20 [Anaerolineae bacterium]
MPRVKRGVPARQRHKKVLKLTAGQRLSKHLLYRRANEAMLKSLAYAYRDRRDRKRDMRRLWIQRINAAARELGLTYSTLMCGLRVAGVEVDRKMLADLAVRDVNGFARLAEVAKAGA